MNTATFIYYDNAGDRQEVPCTGAPTYNSAAKTITLHTEEGEVVLDQSEISGWKLSFDI